MNPDVACFSDEDCDQGDKCRNSVVGWGKEFKIHIREKIAPDTTRVSKSAVDKAMDQLQETSFLQRGEMRTKPTELPKRKVKIDPEEVGNRVKYSIGSLGAEDDANAYTANIAEDSKFVEVDDTNDNDYPEEVGPTTDGQDFYKMLSLSNPSRKDPDDE